MIAAWMGYCLLVSAALALAAALAERIAATARWPRRGIWAGAVLLSGLLIALSPHRAPPALFIRGLQLPAPPPVAASEGGPPAVAQGPAEAVPLVRWRALGERAQVPLVALWLSGSLAVVLLLGCATTALALRRRSWWEAEVDGERVLVAERDGPAIAGLVRPRIVLPTWALALDESARALMLRHEREHLRARDPLLTHAAVLLLLFLPWNIPLWWMLRRLRLAQELDCDARVLRTPGAVRAPLSQLRAYGELLLEVARRRSGAGLFGPALLERSTALGRRIVALHPRRPRTPGLYQAGLAAAMLPLIVFVVAQRPPSLWPAARLARTQGWITANDVGRRLSVETGNPAGVLPTIFPTLLDQRGRSLVFVARGRDGTFLRGALGSAALGPIRERLTPDAEREVEPLFAAHDEQEWRMADDALFGRIPGGSGRANVALPVRATSNTVALEGYRLPNGEAGPGVVYLFVATLKRE